MSKRGNGEGTIYKYRKGFTAQVSVSGADGKAHRKTVYGKTRADVQAKLRQMLRAQEDGRLSPEPSQTMAEYLPAWLETKRASIRPRTHDTYGTSVRRLLPEIGTIRLDQLRPAHVQQCLTALQGRGLAARSVQQTRTVLHKAMQDAMRLDLVPRNVCDVVSSPRAARREMQTLSVDQLERLFQVTAGDRFSALWVLLGTTGLRLGEGLGLKWGDINWARRTLTVRRALQRHRQGGGLVFVEPKSTTSRRTVELTDTAITALRAHQDRQTFDRDLAGSEWQALGLVFCTAFGTPLDQGRVHLHWTDALKRAGLPKVRIHDLRHSAATMLLELGVHPRVVQEMLGHSTIALTLGTYSHVAPRLHRDAVDKLNGLFSAGNGLS